MSMTGQERPGATAWVPRGASVDALRMAAKGCQGCELHLAAPGSLSAPTQTVFSKGNPAARVVFVGEQPGDMEDRAGVPFVGPAGQLFDRAMAEAGIDPKQCYVTNSVKHFRFLQDRPGGRRIHKTPETVHIEACKPWLRAELAIVDPEVIVALGATAGKALVGPEFRVTRDRGRVMLWPPSADGGVGSEPSRRRAVSLVATSHPSAVLRADNQDVAYKELVADLRLVARLLG
jgi:uracil-DNA glycosylase family protein